MAFRRLINLTRRDRNPTHIFTSRQSLSTAVAAASDASLPSALPANAMIYDKIAESVKTKLEKLEDPDPRFLKYNSPYPVVDSHEEILKYPLTRVTTLPNGLRVATESNLALKTGTIGVFVDVGSRFESEEDIGAAHFMEHMVFKGTQRRKAREIEEEIENLGGHLNNFTSRELTTYYGRVKDSDMPQMLDIMSDIVQNSLLEEHRIHRERAVVLREMEEIEGETDEVVFDHLHATAFQHTGLGRSILGDAENIKIINRKNLHNYVSTHCTAPRMVVAAAGPVKHEDFVEQVNKLFTNVSSNPTTAMDFIVKDPAIFTGSEVRMLDDDRPLAHVAIAFEGTSWTDPDTVSLMVMQVMLGSWNKGVGGGKHMGSELTQRVAINEIAESFMAFNTNYKDTGLFGVYAVAKPDCLEDLSYAIMHEMTKLCYRVSETDVIRARNKLKSSLLLQLDGTTPIVEDIGRQLLTHGRRMPYAELFARIDLVDVNTIKRVANRIIFDRDLVIAAVGPIKGLRDYNWFRRRTYWLRY